VNQSAKWFGGALQWEGANWRAAKCESEFGGAAFHVLGDPFEQGCTARANCLDDPRVAIPNMEIHNSACEFSVPQAYQEVAPQG